MIKKIFLTIITLLFIQTITNAATINNINATMSIKAPIHLNTPCFSNIFFILYLLTYDYNTQIKEKKVFSYFFHIKLSTKT